MYRSTASSILNKFYNARCFRWYVSSTVPSPSSTISTQLIPYVKNTLLKKNCSLINSADNLFYLKNMSKRWVSNQMIKHITALQHTEMCADPPSRALVLGLLADPDDPTDAGVLTPVGWKYNIMKTNGRLLELLRVSGPMPKPGQCRLFFAVECDRIPYYSVVAIVGLGKECLGYDSYEVLDLQKEVIRRSVAVACRALQLLETDRIEVENCGHAESAAEGAALGIWAYQELREPKNRLDIPTIDLYCWKGDECPSEIEGWKVGLQKAGAQNLTRQLQETPSNLLTPTAFAQNVVEVLCKSGVNVEVKVEGWAESQKMFAFIAVGRASCEAPIFLELSYYGTKADERPIVLVGQGITYDCGGLNIKKDKECEYCRGDMTGAAVVVATCRALASMRVPVNIRGLIPLCENTLGCNAFKPGDIYQSMSGKSIEVESTNHEDIMVIGDALLYAQNFCPKYIIDVGTCARALRSSLDEAATAVFTNSEILWQQIKHASMHTGDRVWRFPLWKYYSNLVKQSSDASDIQNVGNCRGGKPCKQAAFLREFVPCGQWMHIDATNTMHTDGTSFEYLMEGFTGRPTRTLIEFIASTVCQNHISSAKAVQQS